MASEIAFAPEPSAGDRLSDTSLLLVYALPWRITSVRIAESREHGVRGASFEALPVGRSRRGLEVLLKPLLPSSQEVRQNDEATADRAEGSAPGPATVPRVERELAREQQPEVRPDRVPARETELEASH